MRHVISVRDVRGNWHGLQCLSAVSQFETGIRDDAFYSTRRVSSAFRRCLSLRLGERDETPRLDAAGLQCLSAVSQFETGNFTKEARDIVAAVSSAFRRCLSLRPVGSQSRLRLNRQCLQCLSAVSQFET